MALLIGIQNNLDRQRVRIGRIFRDRQNPFDYYSDGELYKRFRFTRRVIIEITDLIEDDISARTLKNNPIPPLMQVMAFLRFLACGSFQEVISDTFNHMSQPSVSRILTRVSDALVRRRNRFIKFPENIDETQAEFYEKARFPGVKSFLVFKSLLVKSFLYSVGELLLS